MLVIFSELGCFPSCPEWSEAQSHVQSLSLSYGSMERIIYFYSWILDTSLIDIWMHLKHSLFILLSSLFLGVQDSSNRWMVSLFGRHTLSRHTQQGGLKWPLIPYSMVDISVAVSYLEEKSLSSCQPWSLYVYILSNSRRSKKQLEEIRDSTLAWPYHHLSS